MRRPLRILQISGTGQGGRWFVDQVVGLRDRGHRVRAIVPADGPVSAALREAGVPCDVVPFSGMRLVDLPRLIGAQLRLIRLIRSFRPDVVHYHLTKAIVMGRVAAAVAGAPVRVSQWPGDVHREIRLLRWLDDLTLRLDTSIVGSSRAIAATYRSAGRPVDVVYYGLQTRAWTPGPLPPARRAELEAELGLRPGGPVVGMVAYMYPSPLPAFREVGVKGHEALLAAAARLRAEGRAVRFLIVGDELGGDGSYRRRLEDAAASLGLEGTVVFAGLRNDVPDLLRLMDVVAIPSMRESASYTAMEALLLERAVVASNVGGLPDTVVDGETGLLVPPAEPEALASAIARLLDDRCLRARLGAAGREHVLARFDISRSIDDLERLYARARPESARPASGTGA